MTDSGGGELRHLSRGVIGFVLIGRNVAQPLVQAYGVVERLDVLEHAASHVFEDVVRPVRQVDPHRLFVRGMERGVWIARLVQVAALQPPAFGQHALFVTRIMVLKQIMIRHACDGKNFSQRQPLIILQQNPDHAQFPSQ